VLLFFRPAFSPDRQLSEWDKFSPSYLSNKGLISRIYKAPKIKCQTSNNSINK
jgi:hypothetical protein